MFELDFINIVVFISLAIHSLLLWILYRYGRQTTGGRAYAVAILAIAGWILPMVFYRSQLFGEAILWARVLYIMATFTSTSFLLFTFVFPDNKPIRWPFQLALFIENIAIVGLLLHPHWIIQDVIAIPGQEHIIVWGPLYQVFSAHISIPFTIGFIVLFLKYRKAKGTVRKQILHILLGYFVASNLAMFTNMILPGFGYFQLNWAGQFFSTAVAAFTTYAIMRHNLLNIKVVATESFVLILNLLLFTQVLSSGSYQELFMNSATLLSVTVISILVIKSVKKEISQKEEVIQMASSLEKANLRLQELDKQKTEFLSIASHQLRTPLSIIKGYVELIKDGAFGRVTKKTKNILNEMDESNERLVKLVDEFLNITRLEQGRTKYRFETTSINDLINGVIKELTPKAKTKGLAINWKENRKTIDNVYMDEEKIRHVVFNFVDNAIKYSPEGTVDVTIEKNKENIIVRVKDQGFGFDKEDEANFFQKFYRGKNVQGTNVNGTGLGIYVCKKFIEKHDGEVWGRSPGLGKGSEFGFEIPINEHAEAKEIMVDELSGGEIEQKAKETPTKNK